MTCKYFKNFQRQISLMVTGSQNFQRVSEFCIITTITVIVSKNFASFPPFPGRVENKVLWISEITEHFQKCFTDCAKGTPARQKMWGDRGLPHQLVFRFQVENGLHGKSENIGYLWHYATNFFILLSYGWKNNGLLNKNYWNDHRSRSL